jgi:hypothetical protein
MDEFKVVFGYVFGASLGLGLGVVVTLFVSKLLLG